MAAIKTGHLATIAFTTSSFTASFTSIGSMEQSREVLDTTYLGTTVYRTKAPGDLVDPGEFSLDFFYDADLQPPISGVAETVTITLPGGAVIAGTGFVSSWSTPEVTTDQLMAASATVTWSDGPTFTDE